MTTERPASTEEILDRLLQVCAATGRAGVAVSGGVDSLTLATIAGRALGPGLTAFHAVSPAVPPAATARVRRFAERFGWRLRVVDAAEFEDARYVDNPHDRCYFCKSSLYRRIAEISDDPVFSGANADDLGDYRPGLRAAEERGIRHPFVEVGAGKAEIRALARLLELDDVAELPAMPCLSSRVETGIAIDAADLRFVDDVEEALRAIVGQTTVRCRIVAGGVRVEIDGAALSQLGAAERVALNAAVAERCASRGRSLIEIAPYRRGSAFLQPES